MSCELCHGSKVVQQPLESYGFTFAPCPNCTNEIHAHYEKELAEVMADVCSKNGLLAEYTLKGKQEVE